MANKPKKKTENSKKAAEKIKLPKAATEQKVEKKTDKAKKPPRGIKSPVKKKEAIKKVALKAEKEKQEVKKRSPAQEVLIKPAVKEASAPIEEKELKISGAPSEGKDKAPETAQERASETVKDKAPDSQKKASSESNIETQLLQAAQKPAKVLTPIELDLPITLKDLAVKIQEKPSLVIKYLIEKHKKFVTINQLLDENIAQDALADFGFEFKKKKTDEEFIEQKHEITHKDNLQARPPVVTFMGHVDHGKTSLLDAIRKSRIADKEHGGITQHIGAYLVRTKRGLIAFLDTPGHEAFTAMRARGAGSTDIVVLVVAADDGVMPQTIEALNHAKAAHVPIVVAINKIDKPQVDIDRVKRQLSEIGLTPEDWSGQTITVGVSAKTREGVDQLLEMILLEAEMLELKAPYDKLASGVVVEARMSKGRGPVVTVLVQSGTLSVGDIAICGSSYGKIKAMFNDFGERIDKATPAIPAEIIGLSAVPEAGERFYVLTEEKKAKEITEKRKSEIRMSELLAKPKHISLEELYDQIQSGQLKELNLIIKADAQGSLEAIGGSLAKLISKEVKLNILHSGIGPINSSDVILAEASDAIIIGFHVDAEAKAKQQAEDKSVEIRTYRVIYELINEIKAALEGLLEPKIKKVFMGRVDIRKIFDLSKSGKVAGCFVVKGKINRSAYVELVREAKVIFEGKLSALKRFKDDVKEVAEGYECGISLEGFSEYQEGDVIEAHSIEKIAKKL